MIGRSGLFPNEVHVLGSCKPMLSDVDAHNQISESVSEMERKARLSSISKMIGPQYVIQDRVAGDTVAEQLSLPSKTMQHKRVASHSNCCDSCGIKQDNDRQTKTAQEDRKNDQYIEGPMPRLGCTECRP